CTRWRFAGSAVAGPCWPPAVAILSSPSVPGPCFMPALTRWVDFSGEVAERNRHQRTHKCPSWTTGGRQRVAADNTPGRADRTNRVQRLGLDNPVLGVDLAEHQWFRHAERVRR